MGRLFLVAAALLLLACGDVHPAVDAGSVDVFASDANETSDATSTDARPADAATDDGSADASLDGGADAATDGPPATAADAGFDCSQCVAESPCHTVTCSESTGCQQVPRPDGSECGGEEPSAAICVDAACVARSCGDGYREPGPKPARESCDDGNLVDGDACTSTCTPLVATVAARVGGADLPAPSPGHAAAADDRGELLVVWHSRQGVRQFAVRARRYSRAGVPRGGAFVVAEGYFEGVTLEPTVVGLSAGWAVAWTAQGVDTDGTGIALARIGAQGEPGQAIAANVSTFADQRHPVLARVPGAGLMVAWTDTLGPAAHTRVLVRRFSEAVEPTGPERVVGGGDPADHFEPAIAAGPGGYAVAWTRRFLGESPEVLLVRFSVAGVALDADPMPISEADGAGQPLDGAEPAVAASAQGGFTVAWTTFHADVRGDVRARAVPGEVGAPLPPSFPIAANAGVLERRTSLVAAGSGLVALVHGGSGASSLLRDARVVFTGAAAPPELDVLNQRLASSTRQRDGSLTLAPGALWIVWGEDPFVATQSPATLATLLPLSEVP